MGYDDDSFSFAEHKKKRKKNEINNSIIEFEDGESVDDTYYGYSIDDISAVKPKNIRRNAFIITACVVLLLAAVLTVFIFVFRVRNVTVENNRFVPSEKIVGDAGIRIGMHIYAISKGDIEANVKSSNPSIKSVRVRRRFPGTLRLIVEESAPAAFCRFGGRYASLSPDMSVIAVTDEKPDGLTEIICPFLSAADEGKTPEFSDGNGRIYLSVVETVCGGDRAADVVSVDLTDRFDIRIGVMGRYLVFVGSRSGLADKLSAVFRTVDYLEAQFGAGVMNGEIYVSDDMTVSFLPK